MTKDALVRGLAKSRRLTKPARAIGSEPSAPSHRLRAIGSKVGSFSAVSKPIFATKYSFCSIFRDLLHFFAGIPDFAQFFQKFCKIQRQLPKFRSKEQILRFFREISTKICRNFAECLSFLENSEFHKMQSKIGQKKADAFFLQKKPSARF